MYLAISALAAMCAILAAVQTRNAKRLGADLRTKDRGSGILSADCADDGRAPAHRGERHARSLRTACTKVEQALRESEDTACRLRQEAADRSGRSCERGLLKNSIPPRLRTTQQSALDAERAQRG